MDVIDALVSHHAILRQLYQQSETNPDVFDQFLRNLVVHHTMEEKYFCDLLEGFAPARRDALEAVNEHHIKAIKPEPLTTAQAPSNPAVGLGIGSLKG